MTTEETLLKERREEILRILESGPTYKGSFNQLGEQEAITQLLEEGIIESGHDSGVGTLMGLTKLRLKKVDV